MVSFKKYLVCSSAIVVTMLSLFVLKNKNGKKRRKLWSREWLQRRNEGRGVLNMLQNELLTEDPASYTNFLRMNDEQFTFLLNQIRDQIARKDTNMRECISPEKRLGITLRYLATGETYRSLMYASRIHESTLSKIIPEVCQAIYSSLREEYLKCPSTMEEWKTVANEFHIKWNFPMCLGALDGKHINFRPPRSAGSFYYNYKGHHSIVLLALVDANYSFIYVDVGVNGRISDGGVFRDSSLCRALNTNELNFPPDQTLPGRSIPVSYTLIGDDAFPLSKRLLKPFPFRNASTEQRIFNYRISRARRVVENAFGILSNRFRILLTTITLNPAKVETITLACCCLHNYLIKTSITDNCNEDTIFGDSLQRMHGLQNHQGGNRSTKLAQQMRDEFMAYFLSEGAVPWQIDAINNYNH